MNDKFFSFALLLLVNIPYIFADVSNSANNQGTTQSSFLEKDIYQILQSLTVQVKKLNSQDITDLLKTNQDLNAEIIQLVQNQESLTVEVDTLKQEVKQNVHDLAAEKRLNKILRTDRINL